MKQNIGPVAIIIGVVVALGVLILFFMRMSKSESATNSDGPIGQRPGYVTGGGVPNRPPVNVPGQGGGR